MQINTCCSFHNFLLIILNLFGHKMGVSSSGIATNTVELQWLEDLWNHEIIFKTGVAQAYEC